MKSSLRRNLFGRVLRFFILSVIVVYTLGYHPQPAQSLMAGYGLMWSVWPSAPVKLVVCWENPSAADPVVGEADQTSGAVRREWVRLAVKHAWERYARVIFVGWQQCQDEANAVDPPHTLGPRRPGTLDENIKVNITYTGASNNWGHGSWGDYQKSGVSLNLHCQGASLKDCIEYLAMHEFGHTLGFYHEEERSDWPTNIPGCPRQSYPPSDPWWPVPTEYLFGAPDPTSMMAYCSGWPTHLSPKDISGVQATYMRRQSGTLLSVPGSLCLSAHAVDPNGDPVFGWECDEANNDQEWRYDRQKMALSISTVDPQPKQRCLDVDTNTNSKVQTWDCHYGANQQWIFRRVEIRGYGGLCLTRPGIGAGPVTMQACNESTEQLWRLSPGALPNTFQVKSESGNMCVVASATAGTGVAVEGCLKSYLPLLLKGGTPLSMQQSGKQVDTISAASANIRDFYLVPGGQIGVTNSGPASLCMDIKDVWDADFRAGKGGPSAGQTVQVFQCYTTQINQFWNLSGDVTSGNKCLTVTGSMTANGAGASVATCNNTVEQNWDYYW